ncbi:chromosome partitioning protein [Rhodococcus sp. PvR044]
MGPREDAKEMPVSTRMKPAPGRNDAALRRVIAFINGKGGVLKTTLTANVGGLLAASGYRVLIADLDPQGNLAEDLGYTGTDVDDEGKNLAQALAFGEPLTPVQAVRENLDVLPGGTHLELATAALTSKAAKDPVGAKLALATALEPIADQYDMILLDCPPGDETLQTAATAAARWLLIPVKSDASSRKGITAVMNRLNAVLGDNSELDLLGVVLTAVGTSATTVQKQARLAIAEAFGGSEDVVFDKTVRHSEATAQATRERGMLVHELDTVIQNGPKWYEVIRGDAQAQDLAPRSSTSVADDLLGVAQELVSRITAAENEEAAS